MKRFVLVLVVAVCRVALAEVPFTHPYQSVTVKEEVRANPPQQIYVTTIDLTDPNVQVRVSRGGADPDGEGKWQTTLMRPTKIADREGFDVVINGDFFHHLSGKDAEGAAALKEFKSGIPALVLGFAETDGEVWSKAEKPSHALLISRDKKISVAKIEDVPADAYQAIGAHDLLVRDGKNVAPPADKPGFARGPHPRTAVGVKDGGKTLVLVVVDGRKKGKATGMSLPDLANVMIKYGAQTAVNFDGGGSSVMAVRDPQSKKMVILNHPSDGQERSVGNVLGVSVTGKRAATTKPTK
ncbi:MAG TPA: phosphodiester glycosidase family protein [Tepidisphaeraceae bacterium]|jgi:exopolysaccharide biosynthesis protein